MKVKTTMSMESNLYTPLSDALPNLYDVVFPVLPNEVNACADKIGYGKMSPVSRVMVSPSFRASSFTIPEDATHVEDIEIQGVIISRPVGAINTNNDLHMDIIVDSDWRAYFLFKTWKDLSGASGSKYRPIANRFGQIQIYTPRDFSGNKNKDLQITFTFYNVILIGIGEIQFNYEGGGPIVLPLSFKFENYVVGYEYAS